MKKFLFFTILIAINYVAIELISYGFYRFKFGEYDRHTLQLQRINTINSIAQGGTYTGKEFNDEKVVFKEILHPYIGYVVEGYNKDEGCAGDECYQRIKVDWDKPFPKRSDDKLIVGVLGGSVALASVKGAKPAKYYQKKLAQLPEYKDKEIILFAMSGGGFRQPQQLMLLNYYYSLGAEFDLVINIDGFNDVTIPPGEYAKSKLHPSFPRGWGLRVTNKPSPELIGHYVEKKALQNSQHNFAIIMANIWPRNSPLSNLIWTIKHHRYNNSLSEIDFKISNIDVTKNLVRNYEKTGPDYDFSDWDNFYTYTAEQWATGSLLLHAAAKAKGTKYFHFLQPNQYIEGSKPTMNDSEKKVAFIDYGYGSYYKKAYPFLQQKAAWLKDKGVPFYDMTYLYKGVEEPIYIDNCCHVNSRGSAMIVEKVVETIHLSNLKHASQP